MNLLVEAPAPAPSPGAVVPQELPASEPEPAAVTYTFEEPASTPWLPFELPRPLVAAILAVWAAVMLFRSVEIVRSYRYLSGVKKRARRVTGEQRLDFDAWVLSCKINRPVTLLVSSEIASPIAAGFRHPAVIVPETLIDEFSKAEFDHVLLHELAHIARRDDWSNLAARIGSAVFALHPAPAWILTRIEHEREMACDDWVVHATGDARSYATSLTRLYEVCRMQKDQLLAAGMAGHASQLGRRIETLLRRGSNAAPSVSIRLLAGVGAVLMLFAITGSQTPPWIVLGEPAFSASAQEPPAAPEPPARPQALEPSTVVEEPQGPPEPPAPPEAAEPPASPEPPQAPEPPKPPQPPAQDRIGDRSGSFLAALADAGFGNLSVDEIIELKIHGVSANYLRQMKDAGIQGLTTRDIVEMSMHGVKPEFFAETRRLGFGPFTPKEATEFTLHGGRLEFFQALRDAGFTKVEIREVIEASIHGIRASDIREAKQYGANLTLKQIIRLKQAGVL
jgi:beta-lactamase regulating signal transducer with metallopeptidase domain